MRKRCSTENQESPRHRRGEISVTFIVEENKNSDNCPGRFHTFGVPVML
jgi:hypothetical protein